MALVTLTQAAIAAGQSLSGSVALDQQVITGISIPAGWTAANVTFKGSTDGVTFFDLYADDGTERVVTAAASRHITLDPSKFSGLRAVKARSGTSASPVNQASAVTLTFVVISI